MNSLPETLPRIPKSTTQNGTQNGPELTQNGTRLGTHNQLALKLRWWHICHRCFSAGACRAMIPWATSSAARTMHLAGGCGGERKPDLEPVPRVRAGWSDSVDRHSSLFPGHHPVHDGHTRAAAAPATRLHSRSHPPASACASLPERRHQVGYGVARRKRCSMIRLIPGRFSTPLI